MCCAVPRRAVLCLPCCAVPCCTMLCRAMLHRALLCRAMPHHAMLCHAVLCYALLCPAGPCCVVPCRTVPLLHLAAGSQVQQHPRAARSFQLHCSAMAQGLQGRLQGLQPFRNAPGPPWTRARGWLHPCESAPAGSGPFLLPWPAAWPQPHFSGAVPLPTGPCLARGDLPAVGQLVTVPPGRGDRQQPEPRRGEHRHHAQLQLGGARPLLPHQPLHQGERGRPRRRMGLLVGRGRGRGGGRWG